MSKPDKIYYTAVGSRKTPTESAEYLSNCSSWLYRKNMIMRSGGAIGADSFFVHGVHLAYISTKWSQDLHAGSEIYIPWNDFNNNRHNAPQTGKKTVFTEHRKIYSLEMMDKDVVNLATEMARDIHPAWGMLDDASKKLHTRNVFQVYGSDLKTPSTFLICYAEQTSTGKANGIPAGGTATAWRLAKKLGIECFNLSFPSHRDEFKRVVDFFL